MFAGSQSFPQDPYEQVPRTAFQGGKRPTVAVFVVFRNTLLLVNHTKAPDVQWTLPQEGVVERQNVIESVVDLMRQELRLTEGIDFYLRHGKSRFLGTFSNPVPADRDTGYTVKEVRFVAVRVMHSRVTLCPVELRAHCWVGGWTEFLEVTRAYAARRPLKFNAVLDQLNGLCTPKRDGSGKVYEDAFLSWGQHPGIQGS